MTAPLTVTITNGKGDGMQFSIPHQQVASLLDTLGLTRRPVRSAAPPPADRVCASCGHKMRWICPDCGKGVGK